MSYNPALAFLDVYPRKLSHIQARRLVQNCSFYQSTRVKTTTMSVDRMDKLCVCVYCSPPMQWNIVKSVKMNKLKECNIRTVKPDE